jgi:hypothetical protein
MLVCNHAGGTCDSKAMIWTFLLKEILPPYILLVILQSVRYR